MDKNFKHKRLIATKKIDEFLKQQQHIQKEKKYYPGQVEFVNSPQCQAKVINFFGDIRTETFTVRVSQDDKLVGVGCSNGEVKVYDIIEGKILTIGNTSRMAGYPCTAVRWKPIRTHEFVACNCDGTIKWYSKENETAYGYYEREDVSYLCCDYQSLEQWVAFGTDQNTIEIFDNEKMKPSQVYLAGGPQQLTNNHHTNRVFSIKCLPKQPHVFLSGGWDSTVHVWDVRVANGSVRKICGPSVSADSLDYRNGVLLSGNYQNNDIVQLYDFNSGSLIEILDIGQPHNSNSYCFTASFAHKSEYQLIAVGLTGSNKVKILKDKKLVSEMQFQAAPLSLDFYRFNGKDFLIVGGVQGTLYAIKLKIN